jgi:hypothetical protein
MTEPAGAFRLHEPNVRAYAPSEATQQLQVLSATNANAPALALALSNLDRERQTQYAQDLGNVNALQQAMAAQKLQGDLRMKSMDQFAPWTKEGLEPGSVAAMHGALPPEAAGAFDEPARTNRLATFADAYQKIGKGFADFAESGQGPVAGTESMMKGLVGGSFSKMLRPGDAAALAQADAAQANILKPKATPIIGGVPTSIPLDADQADFAKNFVSDHFNKARAPVNDGVTTDGHIKGLAAAKEWANKSGIKVKGSPTRQGNGYSLEFEKPLDIGGKVVSRITIDATGKHNFQ